MEEEDSRKCCNGEFFYFFFFNKTKSQMWREEIDIHRLHDV